MKTRVASILITTPFYAPELTGVGRYTGELARGLAVRGQDVGVVAPPPYYPGWFVRAPYSAKRYQAETLDGVRVWRCPVFMRRDAGGLVRLLSPVSFALASAPVTMWQILRRRPDVVLCVEPTMASVPAALLAARLAGAKTVLHVQDIELDAALAVGHFRLPGPVLKLANGVDRFLRRRFDRVVTISTKMAAAIARKGVDENRIMVIRNWVDIERIRPLPGPNSYRAELGIADDAFICLYSGQIGRKQALHLVLEAAEALAAEPRFQFVVAGDGPELPKLKERFGHLAHVRFLPLQPEERLGEFLNLADAHALPQDAGMSELVLPSKLGGMLASGKRILVTAEPDTELARFLGDSATVVAPGDPAAVVAGLRLMAASADTTQAARLALARSISADDTLDLFDRTLRELPGRT